MNEKTLLENVRILEAVKGLLDDASIVSCIQELFEQNDSESQKLFCEIQELEQSITMDYCRGAGWSVMKLTYQQEKLIARYKELENQRREAFNYIILEGEIK